MGTHVHIFSRDIAIPTLRDLIGLTKQRGYALKLNPDKFDDEEEEQAFLDQFMDSSEWRDVSFSNPADVWVLHIYYLLRSDPNFKQHLDEFRQPLQKREPSPAEVEVAKLLDATQVYYDIQIGLVGVDIAPPQDAIISYFQDRETDLLYLENIDVYEQNRKIILRRGIK